MRHANDPDGDLGKVRFQQQIGLDDQGVCQALVAIQQEIETPGLDSVLYVDALLRLLVIRLMRHASSFATPRQPIYAKGGLQNWRLKRALELLEGDLAKAPSLAEVAEPLGLRPASFCRAFKQSMGVSPHHYLLAHRVNSAKEMMRDQKRSLTEISLDCGFSGSSHFSVAFKRIVGVSPREYRRSL
jgi:AraC family transcriptional regulator